MRFVYVCNIDVHFFLVGLAGLLLKVRIACFPSVSFRVLNGICFVNVVFFQSTFIIYEDNIFNFIST